MWEIEPILTLLRIIVWLHKTSTWNLILNFLIIDIFCRLNETLLPISQISSRVKGHLQLESMESISSIYTNQLLPICPWPSLVGTPREVHQLIADLGCLSLLPGWEHTVSEGFDINFLDLFLWFAVEEEWTSDYCVSVYPEWLTLQVHTSLDQNILSLHF